MFDDESFTIPETADQEKNIFIMFMWHADWQIQSEAQTGPERDDLILTELSVRSDPSGSKINLLICHVRSYLRSTSESVRSGPDQRVNAWTNRVVACLLP